MLVALDWQPWFSYGWWHDIGVPVLGAIGSVAVGAGAIVVALRSARVAEEAAQREAVERARGAEAAARAERREFGLLATTWVASAVQELEGGGTWASVAPRSAGELKQELDVRAAAVGQYSVDLVESVEEWLARISATLDTSAGRSLMVLGHRYSLQSIQEWVAEPDDWYGRHLEATRVAGDFERWIEEPLPDSE
jgi:hypothetical protein